MGEIPPDSAILQLNMKRWGNIAPTVEPPDSDIILLTGALWDRLYKQNSKVHLSKKVKDQVNIIHFC